MITASLRQLRLLAATSLAMLVFAFGGCSVVPPMPRAAMQRVEQRIVADVDSYVAALSAEHSVFRVALAQARTTWSAQPVAVAVLDAAEQYWLDVRQHADELRLVEAPVTFARRMRDMRLAAKAALLGTAESVEAEPPGDADPLPATVADLIGIEERVFAAHLQTPLKDEFVAAQLVRSDLFRRKYFDDDPEHGGNWFEGLINGHLWPFRGEDLGTVEDPGVSPWEALLRIEPAITVGDSGQQLVLGSFGAVHHFFPSFHPVGYDPKPEDGFWSSIVQRVGLRIAAGAAVSDTGGADLVFGAGLQVRSFTVWGIYNGEQEDFSIAIGVNDLSFLRDALPILGL